MLRNALCLVEHPPVQVNMFRNALYLVEHLAVHVNMFRNALCLVEHPPVQVPGKVRTDAHRRHKPLHLDKAGFPLYLAVFL